MRYLSEGANNSEDMMRNFQMVIMSICFSFFFFIADFSINVTILVVVLTGIELALLVFNNIQGRITFSILHISVFIVALTVLLNVRGSIYIKDQPFYLFSLILMSFVIIFIRPGIHARLVVLKLLLFSSMIVCAVVIASRFIPKAYDLILRIVSETSKEYSEGLLQQGYSGAVGGEIGRTAQYIVVGIPVLLGRFWNRKRKIYFVLCAFWFVVLLFVGRRSELLAAVFAFLFVSFCKVTKKKKTIFIICFVFVLLLCGILAFLIDAEIVQYAGNSRIINSFFSLVKGADISNGRSQLYKKAIDLFLQNPLFGIGWGNFRLYSTSILTNVTNVHNMYLQSLCEVGIVGTIVLFTAVSCIIREIYRCYSLHKNDSVVEIVTFPMFMTVYLLFIGLFDNAVYHDEFWLLESIIIFCSYQIEGGQLLNDKEYSCNICRGNR